MASVVRLHRRRVGSRAHGFTLMELVVAMALVALLFAAGTNMLGDTMNTAYYVTHNHSSGSKARYAAERLTREIREMAFGAFGYSITTKTATSLSFSKEDGTTVAIVASGGTLTLRYAGTTSTLADDVSSFALAYLDQLGAATGSNEDIRFVEVNMTLTNAKTGQPDSIRTRIFLRNAQVNS
jgi:prepilin-type N-terminal cleavage/methylation domain-containing protein